MAEQTSTQLYEQRDVNPKWLALTAGIIVAGIALCLALCAWVLWLGRPSAPPPRPLTIVEPVPAPRLQTDPRADLEQYQTDQQRWLHSGGWTDRRAGVAHLPIDEALRQVAEHGLPRWPAPREDSPALRAQRARQQAGAP
jgi:hypothetical protein